MTKPTSVSVSVLLPRMMYSPFLRLDWVPCCPQSLFLGQNFFD